ncbi:hypothetical protein CRG98_038169 [Punica granatum]|uniref:Uncharacterized protein n=1 Tax=Punica granatum TaxID=22663 RepID=A0A2I0ICL9_PUNGR|nr:hypothetical protein CRG98_038169 [Punica granatum]
MQGQNPKVNAGPEPDVRSKPNAVNAGPEPDAGPKPDAGLKPNAVNVGLESDVGPKPDAGPKPNAVNVGLESDAGLKPYAINAGPEPDAGPKPDAINAGLIGKGANWPGRRHASTLKDMHKSMRFSCVGGLCRGAGRRPSKASLTKMTGKSA